MKPSGARGRKNLHVNAVDIQEIDACGDIALNDLCAGRFQAFGELGAVELGGEAIVVDANFVVRVRLARVPLDPCRPR